MKKIIFSTLFIILVGCSKADIQPSAPTISVKENSFAAASHPAHVTTPEEWKSALMSTYKESSVKDVGDGVTEFVANFYRAGEKLGVFSFGRRDAFRKLRFYKTGVRSQMSGSTLCPFVKSYISVPDNGKPHLFLSPCIFSKNGWLFMDKVAVMVDGNVVMERDFSKESVERNSESYGIEEMYSLVANDNDISALKNISEKSDVMVRISGRKGYISLKKDVIKDFKAEIMADIYILDSINKAVDGHLPPSTR